MSNKKFIVQQFDITDKKGKLISKDLKLTAKDNEFITFDDVNNFYKELAKKYDTTNIQILTMTPTGKKDEIKCGTIKKIGEDLKDLEIQIEDYYRRYTTSKRSDKFGKFVGVQFIFKNPKVNNNKILRKK
jgi:hypothetical protein